MDPKKLLKKSLIELLSTHRFEKITVQEIIDTADVSRATFYKYYKDKYDLMYSCYVDLADNILNKADGSNWRYLLVDILELFYLNRKTYLKLFNDEGYESFNAFLYNYTYNFYKHRYMLGKCMHMLTEEDIITLESNAKAQVWILIKWLERDCKEPVEEFAEIMYNLIPHSLQKYF